MKQFNNLTKTGFQLELLRLNQLIFRKKEDIKNLSAERVKLFKAARIQNLEIEPEFYDTNYPLY
jgi:hypothetical protein